MSNLLLIDDDVELCDLLASWLTQEGFQITACHDGQSARQALTQSAPDAVVLDVMLPDGSGLEPVSYTHLTPAVSYTHLTLPTTPYV